MKIFFILFLGLITLVFGKPLKREAEKCQACHLIDENKINVHLIPHSHDDVGWLKTVDQYYNGLANYVQHAHVEQIITSSIAALKVNPDRRYIQVETAFFWMWWVEQSEEMRQSVVELVNNGQLEIVNGAWSMNDEAAAHYHSIVDQFTWGFRILQDALGDCGRPRVVWQIDPFGHSREHASISAQLGFEGLVVGRIDYRDKDTRRVNQNLDFIWQTSANLENSNLFTTMFPDFYINIPGFCFDIFCGNGDTIIDDETQPGYNLKQKVDEFALKMDQYRDYYKTSHILVPMGGDFNYEQAEVNFGNLDKLLKGFENHSTYNVIYSTPSCYVKAVNEEANEKSIVFTNKTDDFFPYASDAHDYWTGYFTSRPTSKRFERLGNNILQAVKQLTTFARVKGVDKDDYIKPLREAMGIMQHHDAITGTEKQAVAYDYARLLTDGIRRAEEPMGFIFGELLKKDSSLNVDLQLSSCLLANISICEITRKDQFIVAVYNPLSRPVTHYVRLPIENATYTVTGPDGEEGFDVFDSISDFSYVQEGSKPQPKELVFKAKDLPPLGIKLYYVEKNSAKFDEKSLYNKISAEDNYFGSEDNGFSIDVVTGKLISVTIRGIKLEISQEFLYYNSASSGVGKPSGAYIFRPNEQSAIPVTVDAINVKSKRGKFVDEVVQSINSEITQIIRVNKGTDDAYIEFDWLVGDLQLENDLGKEIITQFTVKNFKNDGVFYTDSNGREQIKRKLNTRNDYEYDPTEEPVSSNYYPITSKIVMKDEEQNLEVAVLNDRAQGGSSLSNGIIELMIHRRLVQDDGLGVGEVLNEKQYDRGIFVRGQHYLTFGPSVSQNKSTAAFERDLAHKKLLSPWVLFGDATTEQFNSLEKLNQLITFKYEGLTSGLPENVLLLTLEPWKSDTYILRLEHTLEKGEDDNLSQPLTIHLDELFTHFTITDIDETTLGANQLINKKRFDWNCESFKPLATLDPDDPLKIELNPMQIRTFVVKLSNKDQMIVDV